MPVYVLYRAMEVNVESEWIVGVLICIALVTVGCTGTGASSEEVRGALAEEPLLLDVRTPAEFQRQHAPGAVHIPLSELPQRLEELRGDSRAIAVYCRSGARSEKARKLLEKNGFEKVINLGGLQGVLRAMAESKSSPAD